MRQVGEAERLRNGFCEVRKAQTVRNTEIWSELLKSRKFLIQKLESNKVLQTSPPSHHSSQAHLESSLFKNRLMPSSLSGTCRLRLSYRFRFTQGKKKKANEEVFNFLRPRKQFPNRAHKKKTFHPQFFKLFPIRNRVPKFLVLSPFCRFLEKEIFPRTGILITITKRREKSGTKKQRSRLAHTPFALYLKCFALARRANSFQTCHRNTYSPSSEVNL